MILEKYIAKTILHTISATKIKKYLFLIMHYFPGFETVLLKNYYSNKQNNEDKKFDFLPPDASIIYDKLVVAIKANKRNSSPCIF